MKFKVGDTLVYKGWNKEWTGVKIKVREMDENYRQAIGPIVDTAKLIGFNLGLVVRLNLDGLFLAEKRENPTYKELMGKLNK